MSNAFLVPQICAVIELRGSGDIDEWNYFLQVELDAEGVAEYVLGPASAVPEPDKETAAPDVYKVWRLARDRAMQILCSTLRRQDVIARLQSGGWDSKNMDPAYVYQLVWEVFGSYPNSRWYRIEKP